MTVQVKSFRDLRIWQRAMDLVPEIYSFAQRLPGHERFGLADQMRRAAVSIPANIAEGHSRRYTKEFIHHLSIARGSLAELHTLLLLAEKLQYLARGEVEQVEHQLLDLRMPLYALITRLEARA
jgi:four helix bundle protein